ncbi:helix-turn-helix domain-containing protein [Salmonella enterica]|nr:helix-turn-helix domain-containing protein [Salmonella enterica]ELK9790698.1 helix-turn-helix domain-containing protein [Salmonella enterica]ELK9829747.1 helix-turn-helix domain-containing protein [Salmonella enterica]
MDIKEIRLNNLKKAIDSNGYTQTELAIMCDLPPSLISQIMTKRRNMGTTLARKFEEKLNLSKGWFDFPHQLVGTTDDLDKRISESEQTATYGDVTVTKIEMKLIDLFRQMPESEKYIIIKELNEKKKHYDKLFNELIAIKKEIEPDLFEKKHNKNNDQ